MFYLITLPTQIPSVDKMTDDLIPLIVGVGFGVVILFVIIGAKCHLQTVAPSQGMHANTRFCMIYSNDHITPALLMLEWHQEYERMSNCQNLALWQATWITVMGASCRLLKIFIWFLSAFIEDWVDRFCDQHWAGVYLNWWQDLPFNNSSMSC